jgi:hypothetical protein
MPGNRQALDRARQKEFRENQAIEDEESPSNLGRRKIDVADRAPDVRVSSWKILPVPTARVVQHNDADQRDQCEPDDIAPGPRANDQRRQ